jgi:hypothetical protein
LMRKVQQLQSFASPHYGLRGNRSESEKVESCQGFVTFATKRLVEAISSPSVEKPSTLVVTVERRPALPSATTIRIYREFASRRPKAPLGKKSV